MSQQFAKFPAWWMDKNPTANECRLLIVLGLYADRDGVCFPKQSTIAERLGVSIDTIKRTLKTLAENGFIRVKKEYDYDAGKQKVNRYMLVLDNPEKVAEFEGQGSKTATEQGGKFATQQGSKSATHITRSNINYTPLPPKGGDEGLNKSSREKSACGLDWLDYSLNSDNYSNSVLGYTIQGEKVLRDWFDHGVSLADVQEAIDQLKNARPQTYSFIKKLVEKLHKQRMADQC